MDFITGLLVGLATWPGIIVGVWIVLLFVSSEYERGDWGVGLTIAMMLVLYFVFGSTVIANIFAHPWLLLLYAAVYVAVGIMYSFYRWDRFCAHWREQLDEAIADKREYDIKELKEAPPRVRRSKNRIVAWSMFWPWSGVWFFIGDFVKRAREFFTWCYSKLAVVYERITSRHTAGVDGLKD